MNALVDIEALRALPFRLPERAVVTRIRQRDRAALRAEPGPRTQEMRGFEPQFPDIVDYIVRITEEIWTDRAVGRIYDTYDRDCTVYSSYGVARSVEEIVASTIAGLHGFPDGEIHHLNVAWDGDDSDFTTSHLGFSRSTNLGPSQFGPATGKRVGIRFVADCVSRDNRIHTEWLVRDNGALVRQLGLDLQDAARALAETASSEAFAVAAPVRPSDRGLPLPYDGPRGTVDAFVRQHFHDIWTLRRFDRLAEAYAPHAVCHWAGGQVATGPRALGGLLIGLLASLPDAVVRVEHVNWSDETDGVIVATRWLMEGTTRPGGALGDLPAGKRVFVMGSSHWRFAGGRIVEDWTVYDEVGIAAQAYRG